jgi:hypothetical protein
MHYMVGLYSTLMALDYIADNNSSQPKCFDTFLLSKKPVISCLGKGFLEHLQLYNLDLQEQTWRLKQVNKNKIPSNIKELNRSI